MSGEFQQRLKVEFLREELSIPGMPEVALRIVRRLADLSATGPEVARLAATDPTLAGLLLRSANSFDYNPSADPTADLAVAVVLALAVASEVESAGKGVEVHDEVHDF